METISRKIGILVVTGVPAIVGGGISYDLFHSYTAVVIFEVILIITSLRIALK